MTGNTVTCGTLRNHLATPTLHTLAKAPTYNPASAWRSHSGTLPQVRSKQFYWIKCRTHHKADEMSKWTCLEGRSQMPADLFISNSITGFHSKCRSLFLLLWKPRLMLKSVYRAHDSRLSTVCKSGLVLTVLWGPYNYVEEMKSFRVTQSNPRAGAPHSTALSLCFSIQCYF